MFTKVSEAVLIFKLLIRAYIVGRHLNSISSWISNRISAVTVRIIESKTAEDVRV